jgi:hypothetical protein
MLRKCSYSGCSDRRVHHERPYERRQHILVDAPEDWPEEKPVYCSIECSVYDKATRKEVDG